MATETSVLTGLEPRTFWGHFEALTKIPRPSRHEEAVIEHVRVWAEQHGFDVQEDGAGTWSSEFRRRQAVRLLRS